MESTVFVLVVSQILAEFRPERATYTFNDMNWFPSKFAQNLTVGFLKLLSTHPIHIVVWGNFPFNVTMHVYRGECQ